MCPFFQFGDSYANYYVITATIPRKSDWQNKSKLQLDDACGIMSGNHYTICQIRKAV